MLHKDLTQQIINAAKAVHNELGAGLPHALYRRAFEIELRCERLAPEIDKPVKLQYRGESLGEIGVDVVVNNAVVCVLVATSETSPDEYGKLRSVLKALELDVGLLLNFNGARLDIRRVEAVPKKQAQVA
ncbi:MAG: GxxExxY protein [Planctomycetes bacterium]|nr:GxxExxY protein [Planctomycetota bacterium]